MNRTREKKKLVKKYLNFFCLTRISIGTTIPPNNDDKRRWTKVGTYEASEWKGTRVGAS